MENPLGDKIGFFQGNNNIVGKDIQVFINEVHNQCGLRLLHPNHFIDNSNITEDFEKWKEGFPLSLESVYQKKAFRRDGLISKIKDELEKDKRLLILGESGTSKSILLMEIICNYFDNGNKVMFNLGDEELKNTNEIVEKIKGLAYADNQILVVVDNVHSPKVSLIFNVIESIQSFRADKKEKIKFLLAARLPEFEWVLERNLFDDSSMVQKIEELFDTYHKYIVPYFTKDETKDFINKYQEFMDTTKHRKSLDELTNEIFEDTKGYPIMVRFSVLNKGLRNHVKQMYQEYLLDKTKVDSERLRAVIVVSLFDISSIRLDEDTLADLGLLYPASEMEDTIIKKSEGVWKTIHPKWDLELFRHVLSLKYGSLNITNSFSEAVGEMMKSQKIDSKEKLFVLNTIYYTFTAEKIAKFETVEKMINLSTLDERLNDSSKLILYATIIGFSYYASGRIDEALLFYDKALAIDPKYVYALNNKGLCLSSIGRYEEAIGEYDKALAIDPNASKARYNKGLSLSHIGKHEEAIGEYDKALAIDPKHVYAHYNKGLSLSHIGKHEEAIGEYDKALAIDPKHVSALLGQAVSFINTKRTSDAKYLLEKVLEIEPTNSMVPKLNEILNDSP